ncbi:hypothetical protein EGW08_013106 [Elysia chlorotica]|uniref:Uncharacterized protein n=1 Tax=Elysia chlorotica TaxID=188477 RepID=A0A3S1BAT9_ELYCH|nr:hypothetical protein EGW08_013106 [Elysia chlorotica]
MRTAYALVLFLLRHETCITACCVILAVVLQTTSLASDSWIELRLTRVARCSTKDPRLYEARCQKLRWTDHQVARAGLWVVCYSFPKGIVPQLYFRTKPYCADFDDDYFTAEWLDDARFFCILSPILAQFGLVFYTIGKYRGDVYLEQMAFVLYVFSGINGVVGALTMLSHMNQFFLIESRRGRVQKLIGWPFYCTMFGSLLSIAMGLVPHIDKKQFSHMVGERKEV